MYTNETLAQYIKTLAAKTPVPGGGSAAALCGALGTALLEMACNFTAGKKGHEADEADIHSCLASLKALREEFTALIDEDSKAYSRIHDAFKAKDEKAIESALKAGYEVALNACKLSRNAMLIASSLPEKINVNLITDIGCGAELLNASFNSGSHTAGANLKDIRDKDFSAKAKKSLESLKKEEEAFYSSTLARIAKRTE